MDTRPQPRTARSRWLAAGLTAALAGGPVSAQAPAARLLRPQVAPAAEPTGTVTRASSAAPAEITPVAARSTTKPGFFDGFWPFPSAPSPVSVAVPAAKSPSTLDNAWKDLRDLVTEGPEQPSSPAARTATVAPPPVPSAVPAPTETGVLAGPPAYRWFGYGTTTPGANPLAPAGQYPTGSATWYAQSGATPGAFPVPSVNPFRAEPGTAAPAYAGFTAPAANPFAVPAPMSPLTDSTPLPAPRERGPVTVPVPPMAPSPTSAGDQAGYHPVYPPPIAQTPAYLYGPPVIVFDTGAPVPAPHPPEPVWQPAGGPAQPAPAPVPAPPTVPAFAPPATAPVPLGQAPTSGGVVQTSALDLDALIRAACNGLVGGVGVRSDAPGRVVVRFVAPTEAHARAAADAISKVQALKGYDVRFEARVPAQ